MFFKRIVCASVLALAASGAARAQAPVQLVVAFPPGGPVDTVGRVLAAQLSKQWHRPVIVENKAGANGDIGAAYVSSAAGDGSVLFLTSVGAVAISPALYKSLPYDPLKGFKPISKIVDNATVFVVNKTNPAVDAADFVRRSREAGSPVPIGSSGVGSIPHLTLEMFAQASKANVMHVPYKGAAPVINDLLGNHVAGFFGDVPGLINLIKSGQLKALGLAAPARLPQLPNVPTLAEQGIPGVQTNNWYGLLAPAAMSPALVDKLNADVRAALRTPAVRDRLEQLGCQVAPTSPQQLAALIASDRRKWSELIKRNNIHVD
ncbi:tripartite tricarboxylate transporter substrate binding protein [Bordetella sp. FB-8]|uniref:Bug family tripartite tricarboxylate transporter substrate binding protein n=1 Tax=Bordetella sp. FB-8 TaxID=1159870 RepID=UPI000379FE2A|nr:tripartite tricarboxylate transporter substrate binding protein [Bordetella sp. FB-8]